MADVDIILPDGGAATVPEADLSKALAAGATTAPVGPQYAAGSNEAFVNSGLGQGVTTALAAGRTLTGGLTDLALAEGFNIAGGTGARRDYLRGAEMAKTINPLADTAGEVGGLFLGGGGITGAGEMAESAVTARLGEGLGGRVAAMAARGATEGAFLGQQHATTEDMLGDHALNGEKMFATMGKEALLGAGAGGVLGAAGYGASKALGGLFGSRAASAGTGLAEDAVVDEGKAFAAGPYRTRGITPREVLDEVAGGVEGSGGAVKKVAGVAEETINGLRKTGLTAEEATEMADAIAQRATTAEKAAVAVDAAAVGTEAEGLGAGALKAAKKSLVDPVGAVDDGRDLYIKAIAGGNPEREALLRRDYDLRAGLRENHDVVLRNHASTLSKKGTQVLRELEDVANEVQFREKPEQMAKLIDRGMLDAQRDQAATVLRDIDSRLQFWEGTSAKGGSEGAIKSLRKTYDDAIVTLSKADATNGLAGQDLFIRMNKLKQSFDRVSQWGKTYGLPEAVTHDTYGLRGSGDQLRAALEDEAVWGKAGTAHRELNGSFSEGFARRQHFGRELGVDIDQVRGVAMPEVDFSKTQNFLRSLTGEATDAELQGVKSTEAFVDGMRKRISAVEQYGDLSPAQMKKLATGKAALDDFEKSFGTARTEVSANNALKAQQLLEREGRSVGGVIGLLGDVVSKPFTTIERLAEVRGATSRLDKAVRKAMGFALDDGGSAAKAAAPRAKDAVAAEIGEIRTLAGNPEAMQARIAQMVGSLSKTAPKIAAEVSAVAMRALTFLAKEAPLPMASRTILGVGTSPPRYSDHQLSVYESKRNAALGAIDGTSSPEVLLKDMSRGRLNRDAIRTIEYVSPRLFQELQQSAQEKIFDLQQSGKLDRMTVQQQAAIASLLKVPPTEIWKPDFMLMMSAAKTAGQRPAGPQGGPGPAPQPRTRALKLDTSIFGTEAQNIEGT